VLLLIGGAGYGIYLWRLKKEEEARPAHRAPPKTVAVKKREELDLLRRFARKEALPDKDWVSLEKKIKKKPLPQKKFQDAMDRLKKIAQKEKPRPHGTLARLHLIIEDLSSKERVGLLRKLRKKHLTDEELREILDKLRITASYYKTHREKLEKELSHHGRKKN